MGASRLRFMETKAMLFSEFLEMIMALVGLWMVVGGFGVTTPVL